MTTQSHPGRLGGIKFLSIINAIGFVLTILFWGTVFFRHLIPYPRELSTLAEKAGAAITYGFMLADTLYSLPLLLLAAIGLWRHAVWGWLSGQMVNILWIYSMTVILFRDACSSMTPGSILFIPFALISIWAIPYLWKKRSIFGIATDSNEGAPLTSS